MARPLGMGCAMLQYDMQRIHDIYRPTDERKGDWRRACDLLSVNLNFPEFISRICPALASGKAVELQGGGLCAE